MDICFSERKKKADNQNKELKNAFGQAERNMESESVNNSSGKEAGLVPVRLIPVRNLCGRGLIPSCGGGGGGALFSKFVFVLSCSNSDRGHRYIETRPNVEIRCPYQLWGP